MIRLTNALLSLMLFNIACTYGMEQNTKDSRLLLELPYEVLANVVKHTEDDLFSVIKLLIRASQVCKASEYLRYPNTIKLLCLNEKELENILFHYNQHHSIPFLRLLIAMGAHVNATNHEGKSLLIATLQTRNKILVEELLAQATIDVNKKDQWGNTLLHYAALLNQKAIIHLLLRDYRVDAFVENSDGRIAHGYMKSGSALKNSLFARVFLEKAVANEVLLLQMTMEYGDTAINEAIINVINVHKQRDRELYILLPDNADLPCYATREFIRKMIVYRLQRQQDNNMDLFITTCYSTQ